MSMNFQSFTNKPEFAKLLLRLGVGGLFLALGIPKVLGGSGKFEQLGGAMAVYGITFAPVFWGFLAALVETLGGVMLIMGLRVRIAGLFLFFTMLTAFLYMYDKAGLELSKVGFSGIMGVACLSIMFSGAGKFSIDKD